jgi:hypothetical protein
MARRMVDPTLRLNYGRASIRYGGTLARPQILWDGLDLSSALRTPISTDDLVHDICESLRIMLESDKHYWHATINRFFEAFTPAWMTLVREGKTRQAASIWIRVLDSVRAWENRSNNLIHKGTPYYFLGATYLYAFDFDLGLRYIFDAFEEDKKATSNNPTLYKAMPAYKVASLVDQPDNFLYAEMVRPARDRIEGFLKEYCAQSGSLMHMIDFENKFLSNPLFESQKFFFVYSLLEIIKNERSWNPRSIRNEFAEMRNRDSLFDLCLLVDAVLRETYRPAKFISDGVYNYCSQRGWINASDQNAGQLNQQLAPIISGNTAPPPDVVVTALLDSTLKYRSNPIPPEMSWMLLAWHLRNFAAHDLAPQAVLVKRHDEITQALMNALFMAVE